MPRARSAQEPCATTIGACPRPEEVPIRDWFREGSGPKRAGADRELRADGASVWRAARDGPDGAIIAIVREQVDLGIDMASDGESPREDYIHHRCRLAGIDFETSARA